MFKSSTLELLSRPGEPTILVLLNGGALAVNWANEKVPAILEAWYPAGKDRTAVELSGIPQASSGKARFTIMGESTLPD